MVGLGETNEEIIEVMRDLRRHGVTMLTLGNICSQAAITCRFNVSLARMSSTK